MSTNKPDTLAKMLQEKKERDESNVFVDAMSIDELQDAVDEMTIQLRDTKTALRNKKLSGLRAAIEAKKEADADVKGELQRLGYSSTWNSLNDPVSLLLSTRYI